MRDTGNTPLDSRIQRALKRAKIDGPTALLNALTAAGHRTDSGQTTRWLNRRITPRKPAMQALSKVLGVPMSDLAAWFLEAA